MVSPFLFVFILQNRFSFFSSCSPKGIWRRTAPNLDSWSTTLHGISSSSQAKLNGAILFFIVLVLAGMSQALTKRQLGHKYELLHCCSIVFHIWKVNNNKNICSRSKVLEFAISCPTHFASVQTLSRLKTETANSLAAGSSTMGFFSNFLLTAMWVDVAKVDHTLLESNQYLLNLFQDHLPWLQVWGQLSSVKFRPLFSYAHQEIIIQGQACFPDSKDSGKRVYYLNKRMNYLLHC